MYTSADMSVQVFKRPDRMYSQNTQDGDQSFSDVELLFLRVDIVVKFEVFGWVAEIRGSPVEF